jgi:hypothetical protein
MGYLRNQPGDVNSVIIDPHDGTFGTANVPLS